MKIFGSKTDWFDLSWNSAVKYYYSDVMRLVQCMNINLL